MQGLKIDAISGEVHSALLFLKEPNVMLFVLEYGLLCIISHFFGHKYSTGIKYN